MSAKATLQNRRALVWWGNLFFTTFLIIYAGYAITATSFEHTYQKPPSAPGTLQSERWSRDFFFVGSLIVLFLVPLTAAFMSDSPTARSSADCCRGMFWRQLVHIFVVIILWIYFMVVMGFWAYDYGRANQGTVANQNNRANDDRWCCVHYAIATICDNTAVCPGLSAADLVISPLFLWRFWWLIVFLIFLMIDFVYTLAWFQPAVKNYLDELDEKNSPESLQQQLSAPLRGGGGAGSARSMRVPTYKGRQQ